VSSPLHALPRFRRGGFWLFVAVAAASGFLADHPVAAKLHLGLPFVRDLALWQPLSAPFMYPDGQLTGLLGTAIVQWFVGGPVEGRVGTARYVGLVLGCAVAGYLALGLLGLALPQILAWPHGGAVPLDLAALAAFGLLFAREPVSVFGLLPVTARGFAVVVALLMLLGPLLREGWVGVVPGAVALGLAVLVVRRWQKPAASGKVAPRKGGGGKRPRHLRIVDGREQYLN
jgi:membrane associated rhomboid family serine protease